MKFRTWKFLLVLGFFFVAVPMATRAEAFVFQDKVSTSKALAHYIMGQVFDMLGLVNKAVLEYESALQYDDSSYLIHLRLGADYARLNMLDESLEQLHITQKYNSDDLQSHYLLALIYSTQKDYDNAAKEYELILQKFSEAEPQNVEIYGYLGQLYYSQKKYDQAIDQFEKILKFEQDNSEVLYLLGSLYIEVNKYDRAEELLRKAIEIDPEHDGSLNTLGYLYADQGKNLDEAEDLVGRALKLSPENGAYLDSMGWVLFKRGKYQDALENFEKAKEYLKDPVIYEHTGDAYSKLGRFEDAVKNWEESLQLQPDQPALKAKIDSLKNAQVSK